jgi:hypothetical protein
MGVCNNQATTSWEHAADTAAERAVQASLKIAPSDARNYSNTTVATVSTDER